VQVPWSGCGSTTEEHGLNLKIAGTSWNQFWCNLNILAGLMSVQFWFKRNIVGSMVQFWFE